MTSLVVPAHNESAVISRLLTGLLAGAEPGEFELVVVANGCSDDTAAVAASFGPAVKVVQTPEANKHRALRMGDEHAHRFPRLYVDADVELGARDVRALVAALAEPGVLAAAPARHVPLNQCPWSVRWYYQVWDQLPVVRAGLFGRGVICVSETGYRRLVGLPELMGDDLAASLSFTPDERRIVEGARVVVHPPRTVRDLIRRRVRSMTVTTQVAHTTALAADGAARTTKSHLLRTMRAQPLRMPPRLAWFLAVTAIARTRARRAVRAGDYTTWLRDESSRLDLTPPSTRA